MGGIRQLHDNGGTLVALEDMTMIAESNGEDCVETGIPVSYEQEVVESMTETHAELRKLFDRDQHTKRCNCGSCGLCCVLGSRS